MASTIRLMHGSTIRKVGESSKSRTVDPYKSLADKNGSRIKLSSADPFTPKYVHKILNQPNGASTYTARVKNKHILLENPARESRAKQLAQERRKLREEDKARKRRRGVEGILSHRELGGFDKRQAKWDFFLPLHHLWMGYMSELLALSPPPAVPSSKATYVPNSGSMHAKLVKADYHGALVTVSEAKNPCLVGLSGIVIHETENALRVVTRKDETKLLPKQNSIFTFAVPLYSTLPIGAATEAAALETIVTSNATNTVLDGPHLLFTLYGNQFRFRASERAGRKFKAKETIEL